MPRLYQVLIHVNRQRAKETNGRVPWTIHFRGKCIPASSFKCVGLVRLISRNRPEAKSNPRFYLEAHVTDVRESKEGLGEYLLVGPPRRRGGERARKRKRNRGAGASGRIPAPKEG